MVSQFLTEAIILLSYIFICRALFKRRFSRRTTALSIGSAAIVIAGIQAAILLSGEATLCLTLLPITAYLPFSAVMYLLSEGGVFETAAACSIGMLGTLILMSLDKILTKCFTTVGGIVLDYLIPIVIFLAAAAIVAVTFRFIGDAFRFCVIENRQNHLLLSVPIVLVFLMMFYFLNSTTDVAVLIITMLIAASVFTIAAKLLASTAELIRAKDYEKRLSRFMEIERQNYDRVLQKMESTRAYRHDMRHHLAVIEGLAKQGDCGKILDYAGKMSGALAESENITYCKSAEINAVLSEYLARAESTGCKVTHNIALSENLPFAEDDVCVVLANAIENAINACGSLPEEQRHISVCAECVDNRRMFVSVKNPCESPCEFDENGLPIAEQTEDHGIGLRSVNNIAEKYNGFLRCKVENDEFVFHVGLFSEEQVSEKPRENTVPKRAATSLLGLGIGMIVMMNFLPSAAEAASSLFAVNIHTIRDFKLGWGGNSISEQIPEFDGDDADELNAAVANYTDEAREKFMWYFNRRYNGYVAEDMRYTVIRDDEEYFIAQFNVTINAGGSMDYARWIVYDKTDEKILELSDLFAEDSDFVSVLSDEILRQMTYKNENEGGGFFVDGDDAFTEIDSDANFYIDAFDRLVIVFDEYEVAPGFMGSPEFIIPNGITEEIAR